jgi:nucleoid-associated protein YgaU
MFLRDFRPAPLIAASGTIAPPSASVAAFGRNRLISAAARSDIRPTMTDPAVKIASAFCVILAGVCASTLFRHNAPAPAPNPPAPAASIQVQQPAKTPAAASLDGNTTDISLLKPIRQAASDTPFDERPAAATASNEGFRIHKIVDGDTLESLAAHYLGFSARAAEIFEANRSVLSDPEILPIGLELRIPATGPRSSQLSRR